MDVSGSAANVASPWQQVEDSVSLSFGFAASGARGCGMWSFCAPTSHESLGNTQRLVAPETCQVLSSRNQARRACWSTVIDCTGGRITLVVSGMTGEIQALGEVCSHRFRLATLLNAAGSGRLFSTPILTAAFGAAGWEPGRADRD